jgi:hypothetical protein
MDATAAQRDAASEMTLHRSQPLFNSVLQERPGPRWVARGIFRFKDKTDPVVLHAFEA